MISLPVPPSPRLPLTPSLDQKDAVKSQPKIGGIQRLGASRICWSLTTYSHAILPPKQPGARVIQQLAMWWLRLFYRGVAPRTPLLALAPSRYRFGETEREGGRKRALFFVGVSSCLLFLLSPALGVLFPLLRSVLLRSPVR